VSKVTFASSGTAHAMTQISSLGPHCAVFLLHSNGLAWQVQGV